MENIHQPEVQALVRSDCIEILNEAPRDDEAVVTAHMVFDAESFEFDPNYATVAVPELDCTVAAKVCGRACV